MHSPYTEELEEDEIGDRVALQRNGQGLVRYEERNAQERQCHAHHHHLEWYGVVCAYVVLYKVHYKRKHTENAKKCAVGSRMRVRYDLGQLIKEARYVLAESGDRNTVGRAGYGLYAELFTL